MKKTALCAYAVIVTFNCLIWVFFPSPLSYLLPLLLIGIPLILQRSLPLRCGLKQLILGIGTTAAVLAAVFLSSLAMGLAFAAPPLRLVPVQFIAVGLPEEAFFRGYLQESIGNNWRGVVLTSLLFAGAHLPSLFLAGNTYAPFTFLPSLVMGWLYMRTGSIIPPALFHGAANLVWGGFQ